MARRLISKSVWMVAALVLIVPALTACGSGIKDELGLSRQSPDEFSVVRRAPLEIPKYLNEDVALPAPTPGAPRPQEATTQQRALEALTGDTQKVESAQKTQGEDALLRAAGAQSVPSDIRSVVDEESKEWADENTPVIEKLGIVDSGVASGARLDPSEEAKRLLQEQNAKNVVRPYGLNETGAPEADAEQEAQDEDAQ